MDWKRTGTSTSVKPISFWECLLLASLYAGVQMISSGGHLDRKSVEVDVIGLIALWEWTKFWNRKEADRQSMRNAIDTLEAKLDLLLEKQPR